MSKLLAFDTETTGLFTWRGDRPYAFSFCDDQGNTQFFRAEVEPYTRAVYIPLSMKTTLKEIFAQPDLVIIGHNIMFDLQMIESIGIDFKGKVHDTYLLARVVQGGLHLGQFGLKPLCKSLLKIEDDDEKELHEATVHARNEGKNRGWRLADSVPPDYWMADPVLCERYATLDAVRAMELYKVLSKKIIKNKNHLITYNREMKVFWVVKKMIERGVRIFPKEMNKLRKWNKDYAETQLKICEQEGFVGYNPNSNKDRIKYFYEEKQYPIEQTTEKGNPKIDKFVLLDLAHKDKVAEALIEYDTAHKMISAFIDTYDALRVYDRSQKLDILHPGFKQCGTVTGRFSSSNPNLQQVASEESGGRVSKASLKPRKLFGPREGKVWWGFDYSQMEVWVFAALCKDDAFLNVLLQGNDCHEQVSKKLWGDCSDFKTNAKTYRKRAKGIMLGKMYGMGPKKLCTQLGITYDEALTFIKEYDSTFPAIREYMKFLNKHIERHMSIVTPYGRTYYFDDTRFAYRGTNYMIQGTSADIVKEALIKLDKFLLDKYTDSNIVLQIHDEIIIETGIHKAHEKADEFKQDVISCMQAGHEKINLPVPLPVSVAYTDSRWDQLKEIS